MAKITEKSLQNIGKGAPKGNNFATRAKEWRDAISEALDVVGPGKKQGLLKIATTLVNGAIAGDLQMMKEIGDRLDGKAVQPIGGDDESPPINVRATVNFVTPKRKAS